MYPKLNGTNKVDLTKNYNKILNNFKPEIITIKTEDENENDQLSELISISQVPSVFPTLDRKDTIYKSSSFRSGNLDSNLDLVQEIRRTVSFKSDVSIYTCSLKSKRSMLSEAKAKLEILSAKISKTGDNSNATSKTSFKIPSKKSFSKLNNKIDKNEFDCNENKDPDTMECDQITKF